jgi:hypothetical protein
MPFDIREAGFRIVDDPKETRYKAFVAPHLRDTRKLTLIKRFARSGNVAELG